MPYKSAYYLWSQPNLNVFVRILIAPIYGAWIMYECIKGTSVHLELGDVDE